MHDLNAGERQMALNEVSVLYSYSVSQTDSVAV